MRARFFISAWLALTVGACATEPVDPPEPAGTVFPGDLGYAGDVSQDTGGGCVGDGCSQGNIAPGFRATLDKPGGAVALDVGPCTLTPPSTCPVVGLVVVYQQTALDGTDPYNFTFQFYPQAGRYGVVNATEWTASSTEAGLTYAEGSPGAARTASAVEGTLDISQVSPRLIGRLSNGKVTVDGVQFNISAEFNVPVQEQ